MLLEICIGNLCFCKVNDPSDGAVIVLKLSSPYGLTHFRFRGAEFGVVVSVSMNCGD